MESSSPVGLLLGFLALILSSISIVVALIEAIALIYFHRKIATLSDEQLALQRDHATLQSQLAEYQLEALKQAAERRGRADINARYYPGTREEIVLINVGGAPARNVDLDVQCSEGGSPFPVNTKDQFPVPTLQPGQQYRVLIATVMGCSPPLKTWITWEDPDGSSQEKQLLLT